MRFAVKRLKEIGAPVDELPPEGLNGNRVMSLYMPLNWARVNGSCENILNLLVVLSFRAKKTPLFRFPKIGPMEFGRACVRVTSRSL